MGNDTQLGTHRVVGTTDENTTCDCCGKTNLKMTVVLQDSDGEYVFFGRSCAARATGRKASLVERAMYAAEASRNQAQGQVERFTNYLATDAGMQLFLDGNRWFDRYPDVDQRKAFAVEWLNTNLAIAQGKVFLPTR